MAIISGAPAPPLTLRGHRNPSYVVDTTAGRYLVLAFVSVARAREARALLERFEQVLDDRFAAAFLVQVGVGPDVDVGDDRPGLRNLFDETGEGAALYDAVATERWVLVDPAFHTMGAVGGEHAAALLESLGQMPRPAVHGGFEGFPPVLLTPRIFEPAFCEDLIRHYRGATSRESGVMRDIDGATRQLTDDAVKRRRDVMIERTDMEAEARDRLAHRLTPQIAKAFNFEATRIERFLIARYGADSGGYFRPHRDNTTLATSHRRFAVSINLNDGFEGGDLRFPEFGDRLYRPPVGGACVFSSSLLHEVTPVTRGERFAFLPFLHDERAEEVRVSALKFLQAS